MQVRLDDVHVRCTRRAMTKVYSFAENNDEERGGSLCKDELAPKMWSGKGGREKGKRLVWKLIRWLESGRKGWRRGSLALCKDSLCVAQKGEILCYKMPSNRCYSIKYRRYYFEEFSSTAYKNSCVFDGISTRIVFAL